MQKKIQMVKREKVELPNQVEVITDNCTFERRWLWNRSQRIGQITYGW